MKLIAGGESAPVEMHRAEHKRPRPIGEPAGARNQSRRARRFGHTGSSPAMYNRQRRCRLANMQFGGKGTERPAQSVRGAAFAELYWLQCDKREAERLQPKNQAFILAAWERLPHSPGRPPDSFQ